VTPREIMSAHVAAGWEPDGSRFEIADRSRPIVLTMSFHEAYSIDQPAPERSADLTKVGPQDILRKLAMRSASR
jgi:hypothetical protein